MPKFKHGLLIQLIVFLTIVSFLSLDASLLYARQVFDQRYGIIEHEQSSEINSEDMEIAFVIPAAGGPVYHPVPSYPIQLLKEEREELNSVVTGFKEAGQDIIQIVSFLQSSNSLQEIVIALGRNGFDTLDIAFALGDMGYSKEEVESVLPVRIGTWGGKKSVIVGIVTGGNSFSYYSTAVPLPEMSAVAGSNISQVDSMRSDAKHVADMSIEIHQENTGQSDLNKGSCSDELKRLQLEGKVNINTAILLMEAGYAVSEIVFAYLEMALDWAGDKTVELVNCAAFSLAEVLGIKRQKRADIDLENLATDIIYRDILMQGEVWIKDGKIQSSMEAIQKTASSYGIDLNAYRVDKDDFFASQTKPVIIHLKQGHWVVLKSVYGDKATLISDGKKVQMSLSGLNDMFSGNVLSAENIENAQLLNSADKLQIRGSGWGKKFRKWRKKMSRKLKSFMKSSVGKVVMAIAAVIITVATAGATSGFFGSMFGKVLGAAIADGVGAFTATFTLSMASGMKAKDALKAAVIAGVTVAVASYFGSKASAAKNIDQTRSVQAAANEGAKQSTSETVKKAALKATASYAVEEAVEATGVDSPYLRIGASALVGGVTLAVDSSSVIEGMITSASMQSVSEVGQANDWGHTLTHAASITAGTLSNAAISGEGIEKSKGALAREVVISGVEGIANENDLDPQVSNVLGFVSGSIAQEKISGGSRSLSETVWESLKFAGTDVALIALSDASNMEPAQAAIVQHSLTALLNGEDLAQTTQDTVVRSTNFGELNAPKNSYAKANYQLKVESFGKRVAQGESAGDVYSQQTAFAFRKETAADIVGQDGIIDKGKGIIKTDKTNAVNLPGQQEQALSSVYVRDIIAADGILNDAALFIMQHLGQDTAIIDQLYDAVDLSSDIWVADGRDFAGLENYLLEEAAEVSVGVFKNSVLMFTLGSYSVLPQSIRNEVEERVSSLIVDCSDNAAEMISGFTGWLKSKRDFYLKLYKNEYKKLQKQRMDFVLAEINNPSGGDIPIARFFSKIKGMTMLNAVGLDLREVELMFDREKKCLTSYVYGVAEGVADTLLLSTPEFFLKTPDVIAALMTKPLEALISIIEGCREIKEQFIKGLEEIIYGRVDEVEGAMKAGFFAGKILGAKIATTATGKARGKVFDKISKTKIGAASVNSMNKLNSAVYGKIGNVWVIKKCSFVRDFLRQPVSKVFKEKGGFNAGGYSGFEGPTTTGSISAKYQVVKFEVPAVQVSGAGGQSISGVVTAGTYTGANWQAAGTRGILFNNRVNGGYRQRLGRLTESAGQERRGIGQERRGIGQERRGIGQERRGIGQERRGIGQERRGIGQERRGIGQERRGIGQATGEIDTSRGAFRYMGKTFKGISKLYNRSKRTDKTAAERENMAAQGAGVFSQRSAEIGNGSRVLEGRVADIGIFILESAGAAPAILVVGAAAVLDVAFDTTKKAYRQALELMFNNN